MENTNYGHVTPCTEYQIEERSEAGKYGGGGVAVIGIGGETGLTNKLEIMVTKFFRRLTRKVDH